MGDGATRDVVLTLCTADGVVLGDTVSLTARSPWMPDTAPVVSAARDRLGVETTVLRLLGVDEAPEGSPDRVRYLAEVGAPVAGLSPPLRDLAPDGPLRMPWARPGGPTALLAWARAELDAAGDPLVSDPVQTRSWNLSSLWRLPTASGDVWLKAVPPFFAHEGAVIERLAGHPVPRVIARREGAALLAGLPGDDLYGPTPAQAEAMIDLLVGIQRDTAGDLDAFLTLGVPDWRPPALVAPAVHVLAAGGSGLDAAERHALDDLIARLDDVEASLRACGLPDTLVHGDFHPGNLRGLPAADAGMTLLDWGDSGIGHPMLDEAAFTDHMPEDLRGALHARWADAWAAAIPGSDAARAAVILAPVGALRQAIIYQHFLDHIEPDERVYHVDDVPRWLRRAAALAAQAG